MFLDTSLPQQQFMHTLKLTSKLRKGVRQNVEKLLEALEQS